MAAVPSIGRAVGVDRKAAPDAEATRDLYERYGNQIFGYCLHQLGSREEAEDAVQSTFLNAFRGLSRGVVPEAEQAWLFKIAQNVCLSRRRSSWRRGRIESPADFDIAEETTAAPTRRADELIGLQDVLEHMPENQRRAILLREWQGLSYREIAEELELSQAAVETLIFRARRALAQGLEASPAEQRSWRARLRPTVEVGGLAGWLQSLLTSGVAVKAAGTAAVVAVTSAVVTTASVPHPRTLHSAAPARPAATAPAAVSPASTATPLPTLAPRYTATAPAPSGTTAGVRHAAPTSTRSRPNAPVVPPPAPAATPSAPAAPASQPVASVPAPPVAGSSQPTPAAPAQTPPPSDRHADQNAGRGRHGHEQGGGRQAGGEAEAPPAQSAPAAVPDDAPSARHTASEHRDGGHGRRSAGDRSRPGRGDTGSSALASGPAATTQDQGPQPTAQPQSAGRHGQAQDHGSRARDPQGVDQPAQPSAAQQQPQTAAASTTDQTAPAADPGSAPADDSAHGNGGGNGNGNGRRH